MSQRVPAVLAVTSPPLSLHGQHSCPSSSGSHLTQVASATHTYPLSLPLAPKDGSPSFSFDLEFLELFYTILGELYSPPDVGCHF